MAEQITYVGETAGDEFLNVQFYSRYVDGTEFAKGGEVDFIKIEIPGDKTLSIDVPVDDNHKMRFRRKWEAYQQLKSITGTPLAEWDEVPEGLKREFEYRGFLYVEQLASAPDSALNSIMGGSSWRKKAIAFLDRGKIPADDLIKKQQEQIEEMQKQLAELVATKRKKKDEVTEQAE